MQNRKMPVVAINAEYAGPSGGKDPFTLLSSGYYESVQRAGGNPMILPPTDNEEALREMLSLVDGVILTGGRDLDPRRDGFLLHPTVNPMHARREVFDRMLVRIIAEKRIPVLGIGVGMQLLNVTMGGELYFHIPLDLPKALAHYDTTSMLMHRHALDVVPGTLMEKVYGDTEIRVNSRHHQAIYRTAPGFRPSAYAPDGVIEAIESDYDDWFALGTQFHPESSSATALDLRIFEEFVSAIGGVPYEFSLVA